jgi:hypothetical protein
MQAWSCLSEYCLCYTGDFEMICSQLEQQRKDYPLNTVVELTQPDVKLALTHYKPRSV